MAKRRRKLSKDYESEIAKSLKEVELILAKINDIRDDDIREEYVIAFQSVKLKIAYVNTNYKNIGYDENSDTLLLLYKEAMKKFSNEYEI